MWELRFPTGAVCRLFLPIFSLEKYHRFRIHYPRIKISFDVLCLVATACMTKLFLGHLDGLGIGTVLAALTIGKMVGIIGSWLDKHLCFQPVIFTKKEHTPTYPHALYAKRP